MRLRAVCVIVLLQYHVVIFTGCKSLLIPEDRLITRDECEKEFQKKYGMLMSSEENSFKKTKKSAGIHWSHGSSLFDLTFPDVAKRNEVCVSHASLSGAPFISGMAKSFQLAGYNDLVVIPKKLSPPKLVTLKKPCGSNSGARFIVMEERTTQPELTKHSLNLKKKSDLNMELSERITVQKIKDQCETHDPLFVIDRTALPKIRKRVRASAPGFLLGGRKSPSLKKRTKKCVNLGPLMVIGERLSPSEEGVVAKRSSDELDIASVPWQVLWLLESPEGDCGIQVQEKVLRLGAAQRIRNRPHQPLGRCPVRFRPHADPNRWLPRNLVVAECVCEGSPCGRLGTHACVTVYAIRTAFSLHSGSRRMLLAVGCLCALQNSHISKGVVPHAVI